MCGIIGYVGKKAAAPILLEGLRRLEYRGYDSAGVAVACDGNLTIRKKKGKIGEGLARLLKSEPVTGNLGISPAAATYITGFSLVLDASRMYLAQHSHFESVDAAVEQHADIVPTVSLLNTAAQFTSNPLDYVSYFERWREFVRWYRKAWPVRKIVDIPVDDSFRKDFQLKGIDEADSKILMADWERLEGNRQNSRAWKQERLLGGCALYMGLADAPVHAVGAERVGVNNRRKLTLIYNFPYQRVG